MGEPLNETDVKLLRALGECGGLATSTACAYAGICSDRSGAARARQNMLYLEKVGLVRRLDDEKPAVWVRTPAGSAELADRDNPADL